MDYERSWGPAPRLLGPDSSNSNIGSGEFPIVYSLGNVSLITSERCLRCEERLIITGRRYFSLLFCIGRLIDLFSFLIIFIFERNEPIQIGW